MSPFSFVTVVIPKRLLLLALVAGFLALAAWSGWQKRYPAQPTGRSAGATFVLAPTAQPDPSHTAALGEPAPDFSLPDLQGNRLTLSSFRGQPVIVYFWATWCHYCIETMPDLHEVRVQHKEAGLEVLAVNILESAERVKAHARRHGLSLPILLDLEASATQSYVVRATPTYVFIDSQGIVRDVIVGSTDPDTLATRLESILPPIQEETG